MSWSPLDLCIDRRRGRNSQNARRTAVLSIQSPDLRTSSYLGELHKNSCRPAVKPLLDFTHSTQTAGWLLFRKAIHQPKYSDNTSYSRIYTWQSGCGITDWDWESEWMNGKYRNRRWMSMSQAGSDRKNYTLCQYRDGSHWAIHQ